MKCPSRRHFPFGAINSDVGDPRAAAHNVRDYCLRSGLRSGPEKLSCRVRRSIRFDPRYQLAVSSEAVDSAAEDGGILRTLRGGFTCGDRVLRPQEVVVGRLKKKNGPAAAASGPAAGD